MYIKSVISLLLLLGSVMLVTHARSLKDSPIKTIIVPYYSSTIKGKPYQFPDTKAETRNVLVPKQLVMAPRFELVKGSIAMGSLKGSPVNFADGAYPVYYMPGNANGQFNGKISLLDNAMT